MRAVAVLVLTGLIFGCGGGRLPCASASACGSAEECLANRCDTRGGEPVSASAERVVFEPVELAVVTQGGRETGLPAAVTFGSAALGKTALYVKFAVNNPRRRPIDSAFLSLEPLPNTPADAREIEVEAWRVRKPWTQAALRWSSQPDLGLPKAEGVTRSTPRQSLRIDVTELVRFLMDQPSAEDHGLALTAARGDGHGSSFATGAGGGRGPRLAIYLR